MCDTAPGDCGSLLVQDSKVVGMHIAGASFANSFAPFTDEAIARLRNF